MKFSEMGLVEPESPLRLRDYGEITLHSKNQFELRLDYSVDPQDEETKFELESYFFIPQSFRISSLNYSKERFYEDMQVYIRFNPVLITLKELINPKNMISPLNRAIDLLGQIFSGDTSTEIVPNIIHELKMLAVIVTASVKKHTELVCSLLQVESLTSQNLLDTKKQTREYLKQLQAFNFTFQKKRKEFITPFTPIELKETFDFVLEYISIFIQQELTRMLTFITQENPLTGQFTDLIDDLKIVLKKERDFRSVCGFTSVLNKNEENEEYTYRYSILKKFTTNVLYLTARPDPSPRLMAELTYASAAGIAMLIAIVLTYLVQLFFEDYTLPFIAALVVSYMIKDRLKDWLRIIFGQEGRFKNPYDYKSTIKDNEGNKIGYSKESFRFTKNIPQEIIKHRSSSHITKIEEEGRPENIIRYYKSIKLYPKTISKFHTRVLNTSDIIRFDVSNFLSKIEDPYNTYQWYNSDEQKVEYIEAARVYHLNLVVKFTRQSLRGKVTDINRVRFILDKKGIKRIETENF
ncbi:MAG: hypothetical protein ACW98I_12040 [Candidatus Hodarchaeales archaeon]